MGACVCNCDTSCDSAVPCDAFTILDELVVSCAIVGLEENGTDVSETGTSVD